jgi:hypothetical protein
MMACTFSVALRAQVRLALSPGAVAEASVTEVEPGVIEVRVTGNTPLIPVAMQGSLDPQEDEVLAFSYFSAHATDHVRLAYETADGKQHTALLLPGLSHSEAFTQYSADLSSLDDWSSARRITGLGFETATGNIIRIRNAELRPSTEAERQAASEKAELAQKDEQLRTDLKAYLDQSFPDAVEDIYATAKQLEISGKVTDDRDVFLVEVPMYEDLTQLKRFDDMTAVHAVNGHFAISLTRVRTLPDHLYDRVFSKWVLVRKQGDAFTLLSHAHFVDEVPARWQLPDEVPRSKKGLGGFSAAGPVDDIDRLGITSVTVNIFLDFLRAAPTAGSQPGSQYIAFSYGGREYYADAAKIAKYDQTLEYAAAHKVIVSAILLVPKRSHAQDGTPAVDLAYPHADPAGIYAMPNVASAEGLQVYAAMVDFLAQRYSRPDKQFGRIHHWIIHNEVDAGWEWTNAGNKSELTFMDIYIKSMRTVYLIARQYNPHARVYISLTHFWNQTEDKHFYLPHQMLDELVQFSHAEGDFDWSIAYHPYPQSLFKPRTWEDTKVTFDLNTPYITFKNIEVLDAWTRQPQTFYRGQKHRSIFLSEQGFNSESYSRQALADQAAALAYAWKKIEPLDSIEAMQYHNWIDNRGEGGLRIGLRKFRDEPGAPMAKKPIWFLYQKLGTPEENAACEPYKKIVGISDWSQLQYKGQIVGTPPPRTLRDMKSDQWRATDALGRDLPGIATTGAVRPGRYVGIFYFLTANKTGTPGPRDITKSLNNGQDTSKWATGTYYWGQPEVGYYLMTDEWVIRRHAQMLADAGVDVIIFDTTNDVTFPKTYMTILRVYRQMREEGERTPQVAFLASQRSARQLWDDLYSKGLYRELWFQWKGKPLLMIGQHRGMVLISEMPAQFQNFFSLRESWAWDSLPWYRDGHDQWPWIAHTPQPYGWHEGPDRPEEMPVAVAEHPLSAIGRSFHNGAEPPLDSHDLTASTAQGLYFQEQWDHALAVDPEFVFVTGWNEWTAGSMLMGPDVERSLAEWDFYPGAKLGRAGHPLHPGDVYFIDQYNQEFSRDIEPMRGGHTDDYYYQLVANIRRYKGVHQPEQASVAQTIDLNQGFNQWKAVTPEFEDHAFDTLPRDSAGAFQAGPYKDASGRNDILTSKVTRDDRFVYFYVSTREPITRSKGPHWMELFLSTDPANGTGWQGYDTVVDAKVLSSTKTTVMRISGDELSGPMEIPMRVKGNELMLAIPRTLLQQPAGRVSLDFQWVDNATGLTPAEDFLHGDRAPDRRTRYHYEATDTTSAP